jgi:hypothetical protein
MLCDGAESLGPVRLRREAAEAGGGLDDASFDYEGWRRWWLFYHDASLEKGGIRHWGGCCEGLYMEPSALPAQSPSVVLALRSDSAGTMVEEAGRRDRDGGEWKNGRRGRPRKIDLRRKKKRKRSTRKKSKRGKRMLSKPVGIEPTAGVEPAAFR